MAGASVQRILAVLRTTLYASVFIAFFLVYLPWALAIRGRAVSYEGLGVLRWLAVVPLLGGAYIALSCVAAFAWRGLGTPAPFDPPRKLVVSGFYRYVRNPMYLGAALAIVGETALFGSVLAGLGYLAVLGVALAVFVIAYEEPALRAKFGAEYEEYCRHVPRFIPRLTPWKGGS
ncbi:MAG TPA: isoprenylcysteine carboxylmethyltransferase family protein [Candidatus Acidoferrales bacterium]|nr:isoprenylcysteine carboxylmethyltransferase family protein [Candidatus Acidoferrales bacterium]